MIPFRRVVNEDYIYLMVYMSLLLVNSYGKKIEYYSCGAWKNKGNSVCDSNSIIQQNEQRSKKYILRPKALNSSRENQCFLTIIEQN